VHFGANECVFKDFERKSASMHTYIPSSDVVLTGCLSSQCQMSNVKY